MHAPGNAKEEDPRQSETKLDQKSRLVGWLGGEGRLNEKFSDNVKNNLVYSSDLSLLDF